MLDNIKLFRQIIERGFNQGDLSVADEICAPEFAEHEYLSSRNLAGPEILKNQIRRVMAHEVAAASNFVFCRSLSLTETAWRRRWRRSRGR
jgi:hypothetical protein